MDAAEFWKNFSYNFDLDKSSLFRNLIAVEAYRQAALNLVLAPEWRDELDKLNRVRAVYGTTALEGNALSEAEVAHQIDLIDKNNLAPAANLTKEQLQIRNAATAQAWVKKRFTGGSPPISLDDLLNMHEMTTQQSDEDHNVPGKFRTFDVTVGSPDMGGVHKGAPYERLPQLMHEFVSFVNARKDDEHPVIRGLLAHFFLVTIHPFGDGNGRVSRLLEAGILFRGDYNVHGFYGLSIFFYKNEGEYKLLLQQSRRDCPFNLTPFIAFGVRGFAEELAGINNFIKTKVNRVIYRQMLVRNYNKRVGPRRRLLNAREYSLLLFLLNETEPRDPFSDSPSRVITFAELGDIPYVKATYRDVTPRTFYRELSRLAEVGFIKFSNGTQSQKDMEVELDFEAVSKYQVS